LCPLNDIHNDDKKFNKQKKIGKIQGFFKHGQAQQNPSKFHYAAGNVPIMDEK
jgi:hypothetical protein